MDSALSAPQVHAALVRVARASGYTLYKRQLGDDPTTEVYFAFPGGDAKMPAAGRIAAFEPGRWVSLRPASEATDADPRGLYYLAGQSGDAAALRADLKADGFVHQTVDYPGRRATVMSVLREPSVFPAVLLSLLCAWLVLAYGALTQQKNIAIAVMLGDTRRRIVATRLRGTAVVLLGVGLVSSTATALALFAYNGLERGGEVLVTGTGLYAVLAATVLLTETLATLAALRTPMLDALAGSPASGAIHHFAGGSKALALIAAFALVPLACSSYGTFRDVSAEAPRWTRLADHSALTHSFLIARYDRAETRDYERRFRSFLVSRDRQHNVVVSIPLGNPGATDDISPETGNVLLVNPQYLRENPVRTVDGTRVGDVPTGPRTATLLVPARGDLDRAAIVRSYDRWFAFQRTVAGRNAQTGPMPKLKIVPIAPNQAAFNYHYESGASSMGDASSSVSLGAAILVVSPEAPYVSTDQFAAASSQGQVVFLDHATLGRALAGRHLTEAIPRSYNVADFARADLADRRSKAVFTLLLVVMSTLASFVCSALVTRVYCDAQRKRHLVQRLHGVPFGRRHLVAGAMLAGLYAFGITAAAVVLGPAVPVLVLMVGLALLDGVVAGGITSRYESNLGQNMMKWGL